VNPYIASCAVLGGYLLGALSMARVIGRIMAPGEDITGQEYNLVGGESMTLDIVSATNISARLGAKAGCMVSILDMMKVLVPVLALRLVFPESPYYLMAAAAGVVGHNFPVYYRFKGGGGLSAAFGGLLVVDWPAVIITPAAGMILGMLLTRDAYVASTLWLFLLIPWLWVRTHDGFHMLYACIMIISFLLATLPLTKEYIKLKKKGPEYVLSFYNQFHMGRGLIKIGRWFGLYRNVNFQETPPEKDEEKNETDNHEG